MSEERYEVLMRTEEGPLQYSVHESYNDGTFSEVLCTCHSEDTAEWIADIMNRYNERE